MIGPVARSYLYVPGDSGRRLRLAHTKGADAVIADLEDAVSENRKADARRQVAAWLDSGDDSPVERWVRIRAGAVGVEDLRSVFRPNLDSVCLPKAEPDDVMHVARTLDELERAAPNRHTRRHVMPLIETAEGMRSAGQVARMPRVLRLQVGEIDLAAETLAGAECRRARAAAVSSPRRGRDSAGSLATRGRCSLAGHTRRRWAGTLRATVAAPWLSRPRRRTSDPTRRHPPRLFADQQGTRTCPPDGRPVHHRADLRIGVVTDEHGRVIDEAVVRRSRALLTFDPVYDDGRER